jgi:hypothetical protein
VCRKKQLWHQLWKNPVRTWGAAVCVATVHSAIPFACRAIAGRLFIVFHEWSRLLGSKVVEYT